jgi:hypothetical protein
MRLVTAAVAATALSSACGPLSVGEAEIPEICQDLDPVDVPAAPSDSATTVHLRTPLEVPPELGGAAGPSQVELKFVRAVLTAEGVSDLGFVEEIELSATKSGAPTRLASYVRTTAAPSEITLAPAAPIDLTALSAEGAVDLDTSVAGTFPRSPWTLLPRVCYAARAALNWSPQ